MSSTVTLPRKTRKPERFLKLFWRPTSVQPGLLRIKVGKQTDYYTLRRLADGTGYALAKRVVRFDAPGRCHAEVLATYTVRPGDEPGCNCKGYQGWGRCKHLAAIHYLQALGLV
jgi:hypothetical protein